MICLAIVGASARAAAFSARRAGLDPVAADLFADCDLAAVAPAHRVDPAAYPEAFADVLSGWPEGPWMYTGALENHPDLVDRIARTRPLWGNPGSVLRSVRDPRAVRDALDRAGLPCPRVSSEPPNQGRWLVKPLRSAGGRGIREWVSGEAPPARPSYYQEFIAGVPMAAVYLGDGRDAAWLGLTYQWIGLEGQPFAYRGSWGPAEVGDPESLRCLGDVLVRTFGLVGLFGVDLVWSEGVPWPVEINPRYTASMEVLEWSDGRTLLDAHRRVFEGESPEAAVRHLRPSHPPRPAGKVILHAPVACGFPLNFERIERIRSRGDDPPFVADVPALGERFAPGDPVLTLTATGPDPISCRRRLERRLRDWERRIRRWARTPPPPQA